MFPSCINNTCGKGSITFVRGVPNVICCSSVILNWRKGERRKHEVEVVFRLQSNMSHSRIQNKARQITSSQTSDSVAGEKHDTSAPWFKFTVRLCDVKTVFNSDLYIIALLVKFQTRFRIFSLHMKVFII